MPAKLGATIADAICIYRLTSKRSRCKRRIVSLIEGRLPETVHRRSEVWRPAAAARNRGVREARESARQALRPAPRGARCTRCGGNAADGSADPEPKNRHGGAPRGERPTLLDARRLASAWCAALRHAERVRSAASVRLSALRPPLGWGFNFTTRAHRAAGTNRAV